MPANSLFVSKRRGKEQDQGSKRSKSDNREEVSSEVTDTGSDHLRGSDLVGEFGDGVFHHVQLRGFSGNECRSYDNIRNEFEQVGNVNGKTAKLIFQDSFPKCIHGRQAIGCFQCIMSPVT